MTTLSILLSNCYDAPWPKTFNASSFIEPDRDMTPITNSNTIKRMSGEDQRSMGKMLLEENQDLKTTPFYNTYLFPISQSLKFKK